MQEPAPIGTCSNMNGSGKPGGRWHAEVRNVGWRGLCGRKDFYVETGDTFLCAILPQTECMFRIYVDSQQEIRIQNFNHDSPSGNEWS